MRRLLPLLFVLLAARPGFAGPVDDARAVLAQQQATLVEAEAERSALSQAHEALARTIGALKSGPALLPGVTDPRLDARLKEARALAERLAERDRAVAEARSRVADARAALVSRIEIELGALRTAIATAPRGERRGLFEAQRALIDERARLLSAEAADAPDTDVALPAIDDDEASSPDELRELADETRDNAEKVGAHLAALEARLDALRARRRLLRAAMAFRRDDALFAEDERGRRVLRGEAPQGAAVGRPGRGAEPDGEDPGEASGGGGAPVAVGDDGPAAPNRGGAPDAPEGAGADAPGAGDEAPQAGAGGEDDGDGFSGDQDNGAADPTAGGVFDPSPPAAPDPAPSAPAPVEDPGAPTGGGAIVFEDAFDPALLAGEVDDLSPGAVSAQIQAVEARRNALEAARRQLDDRRRALEDRAEALETE